MTTRKRIAIDDKTRQRLITELGCSRESVRTALLYANDTALGRVIRRDALLRGGVVMLEICADEVLRIEGDSLVWDSGSRKATIDLGRKTIILKDGEEQEKKIVLTIANLIALIKEAKK